MEQMYGILLNALTVIIFIGIYAYLVTRISHTYSPHTTLLSRFVFGVSAFSTGIFLMIIITAYTTSFTFYDYSKYEAHVNHVNQFLNSFIFQQSIPFNIIILAVSFVVLALISMVMKLPTRILAIMLLVPSWMVLFASTLLFYIDILVQGSMALYLDSQAQYFLLGQYIQLFKIQLPLIIMLYLTRGLIMIFTIYNEKCNNTVS